MQQNAVLSQQKRQQEQQQQQGRYRPKQVVSRYERTFNSIVVAIAGLFLFSFAPLNLSYSMVVLLPVVDSLILPTTTIRRKKVQRIISHHQQQQGSTVLSSSSSTRRHHMTPTLLETSSNNQQQSSSKPKQRQYQHQKQRHRSQVPTSTTQQHSSSSSNDAISVAIIGGGIAGLQCAYRLVQQQSVTNQQQRPIKLDISIFDTGRLRPGGRCATRQPLDPIKKVDSDQVIAPNPILSKYRYDHAAQVLSIIQNDNTNDNNLYYNELQKQIKDWEQRGILKELPSDSLYQIDSTTKLRPFDNLDTQISPTAKKYYYATNGMSSIGDTIFHDTNLISIPSAKLQQDVWVSPSNGVRYQSNTKKWKVQSNGIVYGYYDTLIIAHNGKCADRLMSTTPVTSIHSKLRVNFAPTVTTRSNKMTLNSIYSLTIALSKQSKPSWWQTTIPSSFMFGYIQNNPVLQSVTCQTNKFRTSNNDNDNDIEVWTFLSTGQFAKRNKAPQEFLPPDIVDTVTNEMLLAFEDTITGRNNGDGNTISNTRQEKLQQSNTATCYNNKQGSGQQQRPKRRSYTTTGAGGTATATKQISVSTTTAAFVEEQPRKSTIRVLDSKLQLWGAAVPLNVLSSSSSSSNNNESNSNTKKSNEVQPVGYLYDSTYNVGVCGDWLYEPSIPGAWISGTMLADHLIKAVASRTEAKDHGIDDDTNDTTTTTTTTTGTSSEFIFHKSNGVTKFCIGAL